MKGLSIDNFQKIKMLDKFMIGHKGFIAGGCFKNILNNEKIKDIDIFFNDYLDYENATRYFDTMTPNYEGDDKRNEEYIFLYQNDNVKAYKHIDTGITLELCQKVFGTAEQVINMFDFTITKFAYYKEFNEKQEVEYKIICADDFFEHLHTKRLVTDDKILYPMSTFERMIRYIKYGYMPCRETKIKIATAINKISREEIIANKSLYDGLD